MSTEREPHVTEDRPVAAGVRAVLVVAVVGAALVAIAIIVGLKTSGLDQNQSSFDTGATLVMPSFTAEPDQLQPVVLPSRSTTLTSTPEPSDTYSADPIPMTTGSGLPTDGAVAYPINLQSGERNVAILLDLSGTYPQGEGAVLQVQRYVKGAWADFNPPGQTGQFVVGGGLFSGSISPTGKGQELFRVRNISNADVSNSVIVNVG